jgi:hypothetical protein
MPEQVAIAVATQVISHALFSDGGSTNQSEAAAQMQQDRADEMFDLWVNYYQPVELKALTEIANRAVYIPRFDAVMQRANAQVLYDASRKRKQAMACIPLKCEGMRRNVAKETATMQARVTAHAMQSAKMGEDAKAHIKDEQRIHDRMILNNIGMNLNTRTDGALAAAAALHQAAAARAQSAYFESSKAVGQLVNRGVEWYNKSQQPVGGDSLDGYLALNNNFQTSTSTVAAAGAVDVAAAAGVVDVAATTAASAATGAAGDLSIGAIIALGA